MAERLAGIVAALREAGVGPGRRTMLVAGPDAAGAELILAAARVGGTLSVANPCWTPAELARTIAAFEPEVVAAPREVRAAGEPGDALPPGSRVVRTPLSGAGHTLTSAQARGPGARRGDPGPAGPEWVLWTSGSTGTPRGIVIPHRAFEASARAVATRLGLGADDRWIASLQPAHVGGLALLLRFAFLEAGTLLLPGRFDPSRFGELVDREGATHASLVPAQLLAVLEERGDRPFPPGFRALLLGGAAADPPLLERALAAGVPVALTYGMTEAASQIATAPPALVRRKPGTVGPALDGTGIRAGDAEPAEILVRGPTLAAGTFRGGGLAPEPLVDGEGWLATGDLGVLDHEGHLRVTGRLGDRIVSGGVNVDPVEVEAALTGHPAVREVAVVGRPDPRWGERVVAVVVPRDPARPPTAGELLEHARPRLSPAKRPREVVVRGSLPRTATGKVDRRALRAEVPDPSPGPDRA